MIVAGLNTNRYLAGNPIPVNLSLSGSNFETGSFIVMTITRLVTHPDDIAKTITSKLYPGPKGIDIDLAPFIKGLLPYPYVPTTTYQNPVPNYQNFTIDFSENQTDTSNSFTNKMFIRGFKREKSSTAFTLSVNDQLNPAAKIPVWIGMPTARFWIDASNTIQSTPVVTGSDVKQMRTPTTCDPFYVRFLNSLGGYSFWMFNAWEWDTKTKDVGVIENVGNNRSLGFKEENTVTVDTRVKREFYPLIRDLMSSPVIQVLDKFGTDWNKIELKGQSIKENNYDDLIEVTVTFDLMLGNKPEVIW